MCCEDGDLRSCCFCVPLRPGVLVFGYINVVFSMLMLLLNEFRQTHVIFFIIAPITIPMKITVAMYYVEIVMSVLLIFGIHGKQILLVKLFFYYRITTLLVYLVLEIVGFSLFTHWAFVFIPIYVATLVVNIYVVHLLGSFLSKHQVSDDHTYETQLQQVIADVSKEVPDVIAVSQRKESEGDNYAYEQLAVPAAPLA